VSSRQNAKRCSNHRSETLAQRCVTAAFVGLEPSGFGQLVCELRQHVMDGRTFYFTNTWDTSGEQSMDKTILAPPAVLVLWSLIMLSWMAVARFLGMKTIGGNMNNAAPGQRGAEFEAMLPASVNWKAHNYMHLMEQPTIFYAVSGVLMMAGASGGLNTKLAWAYAIIRILHSLWQALINTVPVRFTLFLVSSLCLLTMAVNAVRITLGA
jgi:hypothetical protein